MRFIIGPRQSGKTTLARQKLKAENSAGLYYLWDLRQVRDRYKANELFFTQDVPPIRSKRWVCFDEVHKMPKWKNIMKGVFDSSFEHYQFIVTGSSKLDIFRRAGDSLAGRFFTFHLFPLRLGELSGNVGEMAKVPVSAEVWLERCMDTVPSRRDEHALDQLLVFGGFPEPFLRQSGNFHAKWLRDYTDTVIREDIGSLTRIIEREHLHDLYNLLPQMVGSPISDSSLASHLEISNPTVKSHLRRLEDFYLIFKVHPYSRNIKRALIKAPKCYLYDWSRVSDPAGRFENYVAVELMARLHYFMDSSGIPFSLFYLRNKQKQELDFLLLRNEKPWLMVEAKLSDGPVAGHQRKMQNVLGGIPLVQVCRQEGVCALEGKDVYRLSASRLFGVA